MTEATKNITSSNDQSIVKIKVIGVGGGGNNTVHSMIKEGIKGVEFIVANTDQQVLNASQANTILPLGTSAKGLGAGANPQEGKKAALESEDFIKEVVNDADMVIISAGMGGGTGTGAAPIIAKIARDLGILTIGVVTTPFSFEGKKRQENSSYGLLEIKKVTDSLITISNEKLLKQYGGISLKDSFLYADKTLKQTIRTITDLIAVPALINLDFADLKTVMKEKGDALIGIGRATGDDRAVKAAIHAISSPILEASIKGATSAIINISGGDLTLDEANAAVDIIKQATASDLNIIFGVSIVESLDKDIQVSVIATGLKEPTSPISEDKLKEEAITTLENLEGIEFENSQTKEMLLENPLPNEEKMKITDEYDLQSTPYDVEDEEDLPDFLKEE